MQQRPQWCSEGVHARWRHGWGNVAWSKMLPGLHGQPRLVSAALHTFRDSLGQPLPVAAAANEMFKAARAKGRGDEDFAAVYEATQQ